MLQVVPVIDLKNNHVVHAKRGQRAIYQPIQSILSDSSDVFSVVNGLLKLYPFRCMYIADIDAISNTGRHFAQIEHLSIEYPQVTWWVDNGVCNVAASILSAPQANIRAVFGSEQIHTMRDYQTLSETYKSRQVLSLDKLDKAELGAPELHATSQHWPDDVICMTLDNVGSSAGPDLARLQTLMHLNRARNQRANIYAAGGVRNSEDLSALARLGVAGVLIATALHNGEITARQLPAI